VTAVNGGQALLERDAALGRIDQHLRDAIAGDGSLLLVEGPAGIGKTRLVLAAERHGRELGLTTLSARGSELERDFAYGLVRQLLEAPLAAASPPERAELLAGAAGHAARLSASRRPRRMPPAHCSIPRSRSCTGSTGCPQTLGAARRSCSASTTSTGLTRPRCASCITSGADSRSCPSRSSPRHALPVQLTARRCSRRSPPTRLPRSSGSRR
jgi:hypothetical protein